MPAPFGTGPAVLIFDGHCGVCTRMAVWVRHRDRARRLLVLPAQTPGLLACWGLTPADIAAAAWLVDGAGRRWWGAAAVMETLRRTGGPWGWIASAYRVAPLRWALDRGYSWFAANRHRFARWGVQPECERPGAACAPQGGNP